ncbi:uncharacterized protein LOC117337855 isoform X2 [Pecten maximus]|nr:uncharacterized protein LOC117337855 isoform X2 [Pecten maximus]XP_033754875.1 uncharacterized protein LOC117337855 isoform X2 [Pecten maximus]XP_033754876.1 uncharacterized protein LOC117337855 isoform X2 [Pecten maximus]
MQEVPLEVVRAEECPSEEKPRPSPVAFRISIWRFLCCTVPIVLCAVVSIISVHVCKNQGFVYGAAIAALCAIGIYFFNFCLAIAMIIFFVGLRRPFCTYSDETKGAMAPRAFNVINIFNVFLAFIVAVVVVCIVSIERRKYDIGVPWPQ